jgi:addiction module RelE/StbE family toxin
MVEIIWSDSALQDLNDIGEYISKDSVRYAEITVNQLFTTPDILENHPKVGRVVPEFEIESIRELIQGNYRIVYQLVDEQSIQILAVHHSARLLGNLTYPIQID